MLLFFSRLSDFYSKFSDFSCEFSDSSAMTLSCRPLSVTERTLTTCSFGKWTIVEGSKTAFNRTNSSELFPFTTEAADSSANVSVDVAQEVSVASFRLLGAFRSTSPVAAPELVSGWSVSFSSSVGFAGIPFCGWEGGPGSLFPSLVDLVTRRASASAATVAQSFFSVLFPIVSEREMMGFI